MGWNVAMLGERECLGDCVAPAVQRSEGGSLGFGCMRQWRLLESLGWGMNLLILATNLWQQQRSMLSNKGPGWRDQLSVDGFR